MEPVPEAFGGMPGLDYHQECRLQSPTVGGAVSCPGIHQANMGDTLPIPGSSSPGPWHGSSRAQGATPGAACGGRDSRYRCCFSWSYEFQAAICSTCTSSAACTFLRGAVFSHPLRSRSYRASSLPSLLSEVESRRDLPVLSKEPDRFRNHDRLPTPEVGLTRTAEARDGRPADQKCSRPEIVTAGGLQAD